MRLRLLGTDSGHTGCPALYVTDRDTYVVQGKRITDQQAIADLIDVRPDQFYVEIPKGLLRYARDGAQPLKDYPPLPGREMPTRLRLLGTGPGHSGCPALYVTDRDTYVVQGERITDEQAIADLVDVRPDEFYVEIPKGLFGHARDDA